MNFAISEVHTILSSATILSSIVARLLSTLHDHIQLYTSSCPNEIHGYLFCLNIILNFLSIYSPATVHFYLKAECFIHKSFNFHFFLSADRCKKQ